MLPQRSEEPGLIPGKKAVGPPGGSSARVQGRTPWPLPAGHPLSPRGSAGRRGRERRREVRPAPRGAGRTLGRPSQVAAKSGGVEERSPRLREEPGAPVGRVPNAGLRAAGPAGATAAGRGERAGVGYEKWGDRGSSSRQPRADLRGRKVSRGSTLSLRASFHLRLKEKGRPSAG